MGGKRRKSRMTNHCRLPGTFLVVALKASCPGKTLGPEQTRTTGHLRIEGWGGKGGAFTWGWAQKEEKELVRFSSEGI